VPLSRLAVVFSSVGRPLVVALMVLLPLLSALRFCWNSSGLFSTYLVHPRASTLIGFGTHLSDPSFGLKVFSHSLALG
jgi:hypothetical protein